MSTLINDHEHEHDTTADWRQSVFFVAYFALYLGWLFFVHLENEWMHWLTLVFVPFGLLVFLRNRASAEKASLRTLLASVGLRKGHLGDGLKWAIPLGLGLSVLQLFISRNIDAYLEILTSPKLFIMLPLAFVMLLLTAGFTEEFFFRGILQKRLQEGTGSRILGLLLTTVLFGLYHFPYAYLHPRWPTTGEFWPSLAVAMGDGSMGGLVLGVVFIFSRGNLLAVVLVHTLIDLFPAMTMIKFSGAG